MAQRYGAFLRSHARPQGTPHAPLPSRAHAERHTPMSRHEEQHASSPRRLVSPHTHARVRIRMHACTTGVVPPHPADTQNAIGPSCIPPIFWPIERLCTTDMLILCGGWGLVVLVPVGWWGRWASRASSGASSVHRYCCTRRVHDRVLFVESLRFAGVGYVAYGITAGLTA